MEPLFAFSGSSPTTRPGAAHAARAGGGPDDARQGGPKDGQRVELPWELAVVLRTVAAQEAVAIFLPGQEMSDLMGRGAKAGCERRWPARAFRPAP